jgi:diguanylate cyclase (GGDEF)-like protein
VPWTLFLKAGFGAEGWLFVVAEPEAQVLAPIATFRATLALVTLLAVLMVALLSAVQIRRRLVPLTQLRDGTQRIAGGNFGRPVVVASGDELEELATAFNRMAGRLDIHVRGLERVIGLDRSFLEARDEADLSERFLDRFEPIYRSDVAMVAITGDTDGCPVRVHARHADGRIERLEAPGIQEKERAGMRSQPFFRIPLDALPARYAGLVADSDRDAMCFPLWSDQALEGMVLAVHGPGAKPEREQALHARQLCDQLTSALRGARLRQQNERLRLYDPVTGLRNRRGFAEALERSLAECGSGRVAVARISLDGVGRLAERFGMAEADRLVNAMARALERASDSGAARLDASDFAVALPTLGPDTIPARIRQLLSATEALMDIDLRGHAVAVHAGVAVYPIDGDAGDELLRHAETALGHARRERRASAVFFSDELDVAARAMARLETDIQTGLERGQFHVHYQPIVEVDSRLCTAAEALVRWEHPERGRIPPSEFIPVAEESGLISALGRFVLRETCEEAGRWLAEGAPPVRMHVNVSGLQLAEGNLFSEVQSALAETSLPPEQLCLELTESVLLSEGPGVLECLQAIRRMGVTISIDDFGTGYSSLGYLKRFPIGTLKIDRSFVKEIAHDADDRAITEAVVGMAHGLGLQTVAEGVETEEQLAVLRECECDLAQGYLFGAAMVGDAFQKLLGEQEG